jgi:mono/diheme cytochrome c family protein
MIIGGMVIGISSGYAQKSDFGKRDYDGHCAVCHGVNGKGDGPYKPLLTKAPSDLTVLAKNNDGVLPVSRVYQVLDGRLEIAAHGPREMPIWGVGSYYLMLADPVTDPSAVEAIVQGRILAIIDYLNRMQTK